MLEQLKEISSQNMNDAQSLPFEAYTSNEVYEKELQTIFENDWVFVCHEKELEQENDYFSMILANEPIIIRRLKDGSIKAFSNICRHRGTMLVKEGFGNEKKLVCPYHAWTYDDAGKLIAAPFSKKHEVNKEEHCLKQFACEIWQGLVFVNLSGTAQPLSNRYKEVEKYLDMFNYKEATKAFKTPFDSWQSNWKLAVENGIESYHLFMIHKETLETVTPTKEAFYLEGGDDYTVTAGAMKDSSINLNWLFGENKSKDFYVLISLPPSFVGILTYEGLGWISINPTSATTCEVRSAGVNAYGSAGSKSEQEFSNAFLQEDKEICEAVQKAMKSKYSKGGKLLEVERIVVDFHNYLAKRMFGIDKQSYHVSDECYEWFEEK